ncbi:hypothetical protein L6164_024233 [Bauhinia variegata]|uniref:Uncharacterized protein n=1 Tax=Bauhinia variegata TaxID=167791 RepID=A0ACB9LYF0_BAUVA|nr:hypothetical protein L6164_024233 [Bauhinia variegata]
MASRKRKAETEQIKPVQQTSTSLRMTRLALKRALTNSASGSVPELPKPEKKANKGKGTEKAKRKGPEKDGEGDVQADTQNEREKGVVDNATKKTIVIEHCKQCNSFKKRADMVKERLVKEVSGIMVVVNPDKPRRGCFEIREEGGQTFISLLDMKRPFKPMKNLDMDKVIADIIEKIN